MVSRSRWLVGSSRTSTFGFATESSAKMRRAHSPPDSRRTFLPGLLAREQHAPELAAHEGRALARARLLENRERRGLAVGQHLAVVLREVAGAHLVAPAHATGVGGQALHGDLEQRRLAEAVGADDADPLAAPDGQRHVRQHVVVAVRLADARQLQHLAAARALGDEAQRRARAASCPPAPRPRCVSICLRRLWAWVALVFLAPNRSTNARLRAISSSARATAVSLRARAAAFSTIAFE